MAALTGSLDDVLDDLFTRFIMNLPEEEIGSAARLGFQLEQAWWFYDDFYRLENPSLPKMNLKTFFQCLLERYPEWTSQYAIDSELLISTFLKYKAQVPTCGAILLNPSLTKCLMVQGWGSSTWTFPKGKIAKDEAPEQCAAREVMEEIGYDIGDKLVQSDYIQTESGPRSLRLYLVQDVDEATHFQTMTRKEIGAIKWFRISELASQKSSNKFYNVQSFLGRLKAFVKRQRKVLGLETSATEAEEVLVPKRSRSRKAKKTSVVTAGSIPPASCPEQVQFKLDRARIEAAFDNALPKNYAHKT